MIVGPTVDGTGDNSICFIEPSTKQLGCLDIATLGATPPSVIVTTLAKTPKSLTLGPNGYIYVGETGQIQAYDLSSGSLSQATNSPFNLSNNTYNVTGITTGNDGNVWFVEDHAVVGRLAIQSSVVKTIDEWTSAVTGLSPSATPNGIVASRNSSTLYLTDTTLAEVWSITP
jgi:streptogramin lyase